MNHKIEFVPANAICLKCGTTKENIINGRCINDHDDWLELEDGAERFLIARRVFGQDFPMIIRHIENNMDLDIKPIPELPKAGIMEFIRWILKNDWKEHSSGEYWYRGKSWPPEETANDSKLYEMFFGK